MIQLRDALHDIEQLLGHRLVDDFLVHIANLPFQPALLEIALPAPVRSGMLHSLTLPDPSFVLRIAHHFDLCHANVAAGPLAWCGIELWPDIAPRATKRRTAD